MRVFKVDHLQVCETTGITDFCFSWDNGYGLNSQSGSFMTKIEAENFILKCKKDYILILFQKFVNASKILFELDSNDFNKTAEKISAYKRVLKYNSYFQNKDLVTICNFIVKLRPELERVVPPRNSPNYPLHWDILLTIQAFCRSEVKYQGAVTVNYNA